MLADYLVPTSIETPDWRLEQTMAPSAHHPFGARASARAQARPLPDSRGAADIVPVYGMTVDLATARHTLELVGVVYGYGCHACKRRFEREQATN